MMHDDQRTTRSRRARNHSSRPRKQQRRIQRQISAGCVVSCVSVAAVDGASWPSRSCTFHSIAGRRSRNENFGSLYTGWFTSLHTPYQDNTKVAFTLTVYDLSPEVGVATAPCSNRTTSRRNAYYLTKTAKSMRRACLLTRDSFSCGHMGSSRWCTPVSMPRLWVDICANMDIVEGWVKDDGGQPSDRRINP